LILRTFELVVAWSLPDALEGDKNLTSAEARQRSKIPPNLRPISLLFTMGKQFEKLILRCNQEHTEERNLVSANLFGFRAGHSTAPQYVKLADHVTLNLNNLEILICAHQSEICR
jgi:hypothetical protein